MITPRPEDAFHKAQLFRLLTEIVDDPVLAKNLFFKGGTCASMLGYLDRFSVDLDFDLAKEADEKNIKKIFYKIFKELDLEIKDESKNALQFFLRYKTKKERQRNTVKLDALSDYPLSNQYEIKYIAEIDRMVGVQTVETMFANKLVALTDRYKKNGSIAGRDLYDIQHFLINGYNYNREIIKERTGKVAKLYILELIKFIEKNITQTIINQDLNSLLPADTFRKISKNLKTETVMLLKDELTRG